MKLELKHLTPYLPYGVDVKLGHTIRELTAVSLDSRYFFVTAYKGAREKQMVGIESIIPILRPLSDITKEIEHNGEKFVPLRWFENEGWFGNDLLRGMVKNKYINIETLPYCIVEKLSEWHFDVFGLIDAGIAIERE
jgi:hypothetical protein